MTAAPLTPVSPGKIAFVDDVNASGTHGQLYIEQSDGSNVRRLVTSAFNDGNPALSPDGTLVSFVRSHDPDPDRIFVVNADGSGVHQLIPTNCPSRCGDAAEGHPWSPDGRQIVFTRAIFAGSDATPSNVGLWIMNADGSGAHQVTLAGARACQKSCAGGAQDDNAGWSPDGKRLVFRRWIYGSPDRFEIFTVATNGTDLRRVTAVNMNAEDPAWSPDGNLIVFQSPPDPEQGSAQALYTIHPDGTGLAPLTPHLSSMPDGSQATNHASWSPDGKQIAFAHAPSSTPDADLFVVNRDGTDLHVLKATPLIENAPFWGRNAG